MDSASIEAAKQADMVLITTQAQIFAIETLEPLKRLLDMAGNPPAFVVLNLVHRNAGGRAAAAAAIADPFNISVAPIHMSRLKAYEAAPALGQTPQELEPQGRAAQEIAGLFSFLSEQASMSRKPSLLTTAMKTAEQPTVSKWSARGRQSAGTYVPPSRANKSAKTLHLPPVYWERLEELSVRTRDDKGKRVTQQRLVAQALNLLFAKYNFPIWLIFDRVKSYSTRS